MRIFSWPTVQVRRPFVLKAILGFALVLGLSGCASYIVAGFQDLPKGSLELERPSLAMEQILWISIKRREVGPFRVATASLGERYFAAAEWLRKYCEFRGKGKFSGPPGDMVCTAPGESSDRIIFAAKIREEHFKHRSSTGVVDIYEPYPSSSTNDQEAYLYDRPWTMSDTEVRPKRPSMMVREKIKAEQDRIEAERRYGERLLLEMAMPIRPGAQVCRINGTQRARVELKYDDGNLRLLLPDGRSIIDSEFNWTVCS